MTEAERLERIESRLSSVERDNAVLLNDRAHMDKRFDKLEGKLDWIGKVLIAAILAAVARFIMDGGLNVSP